MSKFKIAIWDNSEQNFDIRNPSKKLLTMEVEVLEFSHVPAMPLLHALKAMYPSTDIEILCSEIITTSKNKEDIECPTIK
jgi:hypothetical protein